jgi:hypothetical protein
VRALWGGRDAGDVAGAACAEVELWGVDLSSLPGFREAVADHLARLDADLRRAFEALLTAPPARP